MAAMKKGSAKKGIAEVRARIDAVDDKIAALLRKRADLAGEAADAKKAQPGAVFARPEREAEILRRLSAAGGKLPRPAVRAIYREIISACLALEKPQTVCYLGPPHTFTHDAARKHFGASAEYIPASSVGAVFARAEKGLCDFAVFPFENSGEGTVGEAFDALLETPLSLCGEIMLRVRHNFLAASPILPEEVKTVYGHPQALAQCRRWLAQNAPKAALAAMESNAAAARYVAQSGAGKKIAAIASLSAAKHYKLAAAASDIEDSAYNTTRFLIASAACPAPSSADKTSFMMTVHSKAGALYRLLEPFSRLKINMTKFESRPSRAKMWEYVFYTDIDGHRDSPQVARALDEIGKLAPFLKVLGSYPRAEE